MFRKQTVCALLIGVLGLPLALTQSEVPTLGLHGSGTTNPSKCYWDILASITNGIRFPSHLTYRGVGSTIGMEEISNGLNATGAPIAYASGDIPIPTEDYNAMKESGVEVMHLPVLLGAVSVFHTVPVAAPHQLNLTSCILARIFMGEIPRWDHPSIARLNPNLLAQGMQIHVVVRDAGSSSTSSFTEYLNQACGESFPTSMVSDYPEGWPSRFSQCSGSSGVVGCIREREGSIGYVDAGHGVDAGLAEIELENRDGTFLSSSESMARDGIAAAARNQFPNNPLNDFGSVSLVNRPGRWTWPIVQATYLYVRRNITYIGTSLEQSLLVAFLESFLIPEVVRVCSEENGFTIPSTATQDIVRRGIETIKQGLPASARTWTWEIDATALVGADMYTISTKRRGVDAVQIEDLQSMVASMQRTIESMQTSMQEMSATLEQSGLLANNASTGGSSNDANAKAALVLGSLSFVLAMGILASMFFNRKSRKTDFPPPSLEQPQTVGA